MFSATRPSNERMRTVALLKSPDYARHAEQTGTLPYRIDLLHSAGYRPTWTDRHLHGWSVDGRLRRLVARSEVMTTPWVQAVLTWSQRRSSDAVLAMFESEGHGLALARRFVPRRGRPPLVILSCWLTDLATTGGPRRRWLYRFLYGRVDGVIVLSGNQVKVLEEQLGLRSDQISVVRFGVDLDELRDLESHEDGSVAAVGRDLGRDWRCLAAAADGTRWRVQLVTRPEQLSGVNIPDSVTVHETLPRSAYLDVLRNASVVALPSEVRQYPTGQTVLLEAMALGTPVISTDIAGIPELIEHGRSGWLVPPYDPTSLAGAIERLRETPTLRARLSQAALARVRADFDLARNVRQLSGLFLNEGERR